MYNSFYGGKQGRSFNIVKYYDSINQMVTDFSRGASYTEVSYDEFVIIDTIINNNQKSNPENGIIYRRGYNSSQQGTTFNGSNWKEYVTNPGGGAIYIGQVVGPQGSSPEITLADYSSEIEATSSIIIDPVPGKENNVYNDEINCQSVTIEDENGNVTGAILAFQFPYTVFNFEATNISPYNVPQNLITEETDSKNHIYYKHYQIKIPQGIHGKDVTSLVIEEDSDDNNKQKLVYYSKDYTNTAEPSEVKTILGEYNIIDEISSSTKSGYTYPEKIIFKQTASEDVEFDYSVIERIYIQNSRLYVQLSNKTTPEDLGEIRSIESIWCQSQNENRNTYTLYKNHIYIQYTTGIIQDLGLIKQVEKVWTQKSTDPAGVDSDNNPLTEDYIYSQLSEEAPCNLGYIQKVRNITRNSTNKNFYINYNIGNSELFPVTEIADVHFNGDNLIVGFKNSEAIDFSDVPANVKQYDSVTGITYINFGGMVRGTHVFTNFNTLADLNTTYPNGLGNTVETEGRAGWIVTVGHDNSIIIVNNSEPINVVVDESTITLNPGQTVPSTIASIENNTIVLASGIDSSVASYLQIEQGTSGKSLYAFNYITTPGFWYLIQNSSASAIDPEYSVLVGKSNDPNVMNNALNDGGVWFVVTE